MRHVIRVLIAIAIFLGFTTQPVQAQPVYSDSPVLSWEDQIWISAISEFDHLYHRITKEQVRILRMAGLEFEAAFHAAPVSVEPTYELYIQAVNESVSPDPMDVEYVDTFDSMTAAMSFGSSVQFVNAHVFGSKYAGMTAGIVITNQDGNVLYEEMYGY